MRAEPRPVNPFFALQHDAELMLEDALGLPSVVGILPDWLSPDMPTSVVVWP